MALFDDVLLTVDFDRTLTAPDSSIPQRNLEAIDYFIKNGGSFTVNTGRSAATFWMYLDTLPVNAPFLLYNGSAAYEKGALFQIKEIDLPLWQTIQEVAEQFPDMNLEIQGADMHYLVNPREEMIALYEAMNWRYTPAVFGADVGPFMKFALFGKPRVPAVSDLFSATKEEEAQFAEAVKWLEKKYGDKVEIFLSAPRIIDVHAKGVSKNAAARALQKRLGKKILVCVGDAENDVAMLDGADYAFCPADGVVADRYETVCECALGAVADVIYKKIPEILGFPLDSETILC